MPNAAAQYAPLPEPTALDVACQAWRNARYAEDEARKDRLIAEERILSEVGCKEEGATTVKTQWFKVSATGSLTRKLIPEHVTKLRALLDIDVLEQVISYEPKLSVSGLKAVAVSNPEAYRVLCSAIVTKPAKPSIKVEVL